MKLKILITLLPCLVAGAAHAQVREITVSEQEIKALGPLPDDKRAETLAKNERNPFAERIIANPELKEDGESEDAKLNSILQKVKISGIIKESNGHLGVMVADRLYREGDKLAPLIPNQTALLRVSKVSDKEIEFTWVESQPDTVPRRATRKISVNEPIVKQQLRFVGDDEAAKNGHVIRVTTSGEFLKEEKPAESAADDASPGDTGATLNSRGAPATPRGRAYLK